MEVCLANIRISARILFLRCASDTMGSGLHELLGGRAAREALRSLLSPIVRILRQKLPVGRVTLPEGQLPGHCRRGEQFPQLGLDEPYFGCGSLRSCYYTEVHRYQRPRSEARFLQTECQPQLHQPEEVVCHGTLHVAACARCILSISCSPWPACTTRTTQSFTPFLTPCYSRSFLLFSQCWAKQCVGFLEHSGACPIWFCGCVHLATRLELGESHNLTTERHKISEDSCRE